MSRDAAGNVTIRTAPARIDLAGGTVDIHPLCQLVDGAATVNVAIDRRATATVRLRDDGRCVLVAADRGVSEQHDGPAAAIAHSELGLHREALRHFAPECGVELTTRSGVPAGSGLGGSSTLMVAIVAALSAALGSELTGDDLLTHVGNIEMRLIRVPVGSQDYLAAIHGGVGFIDFPAAGPRHTRLDVDADDIASRTVLVDTGKPHFSGTNNWAITKALVDGDAAVRDRLTELGSAARSLRAALLRDDLDEGVGRAIDADWTARRLLAPGVTTPRIEELIAVGREAGALAAKVCGAGGGGCLVLWCPPERRGDVEAAVREEGAPVLDVRVARNGVG